jgi:hypothetical protein
MILINTRLSRQLADVAIPTRFERLFAPAESWQFSPTMRCDVDQTTNDAKKKVRVGVEPCA